ncbi:hypothetical protein BGZ94_005187 [Podila epigama]|nr:hypothetical protein BGZ94_005187 [Podila epigama]
MSDMMAHASSADAPFDSEVSFADLDNEALVTALSANPLPTFLAIPSSSSSSSNTSSITITSPSNTTTPTTTPNCDPSIIAISPLSLNLKLESPPMPTLAEPTPELELETSSRRRRKATAAPSTATATVSPSATATATAAAKTIPKKRSASSEPLDKEAKARERVLRNRAAAQESRDKKRKYVAEIEASNESLQQENKQLLKRLKTVESDNLTLAHKLETLTAQFAQMQQQLSLTGMMNNNSGVGFCQSAVLAKKAKTLPNVSTNSPQQKLAPPTRSLYHNPHKNNHRRRHSMTMKNSMVKKSLNKEAPDQSAAARWTETSCRSFCNNSNKALTLSSSAAASFQLQLVAMALLARILPQLMLTFSTLFLISTGVQSNSLLQPAPPSATAEQRRLYQAVQSFIHRISQPLSSPLSSSLGSTASVPLFQSKPIKDSITSLNATVIEEIVTEFRQGRKDAARRLLVKALLSKS